MMSDKYCRVHKPGVPHGPASQQRFGPAEQHCEQRVAHGPAQTPKRQARRTIHSLTRRPSRGGTTSTSASGPPLRPKGLMKKEQHSLSTPTHLQTASPIGGPGQTPLFDSDPLLRPGMRRTPAYSSSPTSAVRANWDQPTGDVRSVRTRKQMEKLRQGTQVIRNTEERTLYTCRTVPYDFPGMTEPKQCCRCRHFPYNVVGAINSHIGQI